MESSVNRRRMMGKKRGYTGPVSWIGSNGTQYIDTGIVLSQAHKSVVYMLDMQKSSSGVYGSMQGYTNGMHAFSVGDSTINFLWGWNDSYYRNPFSDIKPNENHTFTLESISSNTYATMKVSKAGSIDASINAQKSNYSTVYPAYIFAINNGGNLYGVTSTLTKISRVIIYENGTKISDMKAWVKDDVPCMYDSIRDMYLYNQGTGNFIIPQNN